MRFTWDVDKAVANERKHNVDFPTAALVFGDPGRFERRDSEHSDHEERMVVIGCDGTRVLYVVYTEREDDAIRIISARKATKYEEKSYRYARYRL